MVCYQRYFCARRASVFLNGLGLVGCAVVSGCARGDSAGPASSFATGSPLGTGVDAAGSSSGSSGQASGASSGSLFASGGIAPSGEAALESGPDEDMGPSGNPADEAGPNDAAAIAVTCDAAFTACTSAGGGMPSCTDTQTDSDNCGQCGRACPTGQRCSSGVCGFSIGGMLTGLSPGDSIQLESNGGDATTLSSNGPFMLASPVPADTGYSVSAAMVNGAPIPETCAVQNRTGTATMPVSNVNVICIPADVLYYFPFTGNTKDASGNGNDGVITGNVTLTADRSGASNSAYHFDGATGYISAPGGRLPLNAMSRTLTAWMEPLVAMEDYGVVSWGSGNCTALMFGIGVKNNDLATIWEGCNDDISTLAVPLNMWSFVAVVFSSASPTAYTLYVNNQSVNVQLTVAPATAAGSLLMGYNMSNSGNTYFNGNLDSVRVYGRALSPSEIQGIFTGGGP